MQPVNTNPALRQQIELGRWQEKVDADHLAGMLGSRAAAFTRDNLFGDFFSRDAARVHRARGAAEWVIYKSAGLLRLIDEATARGYHRYPAVAGALRLYVRGVLGDFSATETVARCKQSRVLAHPDKLFPQLVGGKAEMRRRIADAVWVHHQKASSLVQSDSIRSAIFAVPCPSNSKYPMQQLLGSLDELPREPDEGLASFFTWRWLRQLSQSVRRLDARVLAPAAGAAIVGASSLLLGLFAAGAGLVTVAIVPAIAALVTYFLAVNAMRP